MYNLTEGALEVSMPTKSTLLLRLLRNDENLIVSENHARRRSREAGAPSIGECEWFDRICHVFAGRRIEICLFRKRDFFSQQHLASRIVTLLLFLNYK